MKKFYETPFVEVVTLNTEDVITKSGLIDTTWSEEEEDQTGFGQWAN